MPERRAAGEGMQTGTKMALYLARLPGCGFRAIASDLQLHGRAKPGTVGPG
jgi:hypothetical protein